MKNKLKNLKNSVLDIWRSNNVFRFFCYIFIIMALLVGVLCLDLCNISGLSNFIGQDFTCLSNINFEKFGVVATIVLTLGLFITTYVVQDLAKSKKVQDDSFDAIYLVLSVMKNSYLTLKKEDNDFFAELKKLKKSSARCSLSDADMQFFQTYPFKNYEELINGYMVAGLVPTNLAERYIQHKTLFGKYVVQYVRSDTRCENSIRIIENQLTDSIKKVHRPKRRENKEKIAAIEQEIKNSTNSEKLKK